MNTHAVAPPTERSLSLTTDGQLRLTCWAGTDDGVPLVLLHGLGQLGAVWAAVAAQLAGPFSILAPDLRGHGDSSRDQSGGYHLETFVSDVATLLRREAPSGAVLVGHSLGGRIVAEIALTDRAHLLGAVIVDSGTQTSPAAMTQLRRLLIDEARPTWTRDGYREHLARLYPLAQAAHLAPLADQALRPVGGGFVEKVDPAVLSGWLNGSGKPWPVPHRVVPRYCSCGASPRPSCRGHRIGHRGRRLGRRVGGDPEIRSRRAARQPRRPRRCDQTVRSALPRPVA